MNVVEDKGQELVQLVSRIGVRAPLRSWDALQRSNSMRTAEPNSHKEESSEDNSRRGFQLQPVADPPAAADTLETLRFGPLALPSIDAILSTWVEDASLKGTEDIQGFQDASSKYPKTSRMGAASFPHVAQHSPAIARVVLGVATVVGAEVGVGVEVAAGVVAVGAVGAAAENADAVAVGIAVVVVASAAAAA
eukprot:CAMPEP_0194759886 /NCGR_PEP_ID=MMETSP0323_2-20130528/12869_1 /TAXON_ID=2866 ORGANISM="Crypthecodinium cohnii, Strain Seligo" /NCGR_SAMPLE_ID=MMETSP0323_2 /ASSEMBLY_ACC=CAM_ASM_000346 /LENGTH=192 /DNA_ID=CAMNT_0039680853 /DNA_START=140 /DNA_END=716 /DNA_ORIENTATION=-